MAHSLSRPPWTNAEPTQVNTVGRRERPAQSRRWQCMVVVNAPAVDIGATFGLPRSATEGVRSGIQIHSARADQESLSEALACRRIHRGGECIRNFCRVELDITSGQCTGYQREVGGRKNLGFGGEPVFGVGSVPDQGNNGQSADSNCDARRAEGHGLPNPAPHQLSY